MAAQSRTGGRLQSRGFAEEEYAPVPGDVGGGRFSIGVVFAGDDAHVGVAQPALAHGVFGQFGGRVVVAVAVGGARGAEDPLGHGEAAYPEERIGAYLHAGGDTQVGDGLLSSSR